LELEMAIHEPIIIDADVVRVQDDATHAKAKANAGAGAHANAQSTSSAPRKPLSKLKRVLIVLFAVIYVLSPLDLLPEMFLGPIGLLDDLGVLAWAARELFFRNDA
jgi:uncharacterized membrane protein YkvA (DUF1232 family)